MKQLSNLALATRNMQLTELKSLRYHVNACVESDVMEESMLGQIDQMIDAHYLSLHNHKIFYQEKVKKYKTHVDLPDESKKRYRQVASVSLEKLKKKLVAYYKSVEKSTTISALFRMWIEERMRYNEIEKATIDRYETDFVRAFVASGFSGRYIDEITEEEWMESDCNPGYCC